MKRLKNLIIILVLAAAIAVSSAVAFFSLSGTQRRYLFRQEKEFYLVDAKLNGDTVASMLNAAESKIVFDTDGNATLYVVPNDFILNLANIALVVMLGDSGLDLSSEDLQSFFSTYVSQGLFPGFEFTDLKSSLELLKSIGVSIEGVDWDAEPLASVVRSVEENLLIPAGFTLPDGVYLKLEGKYYITDEGEYKAVHMMLNNVSEKGEPFLIMTYSKEDGVENIFARVEFVKIDIYAATK